MSSCHPIPTTPAVPSAEEAQLAAESSRVIATVIGRGTAATVRLDLGSETVRVPVAAFKLFAELLTQMSLGRAVQIVPHNAELTTQEAADFLNVSRPYLVKQLEAGALPFHLVGTHRRVYFGDLVAYRDSMKRSQRAALDELTSLSQDLGLGA